MIIVLKIVGEGFDLTSGAETAKSIVLSNGIRELTVQVNEDVIKEVISMSLESSKISASMPDRGSFNVVDQHTNVPHVDIEALRPPQAIVSTESEEDLADINAVMAEDTAGSEYDDPTSGVASI